MNELIRELYAVLVPFLLVVLAISIHAFTDANRKKGEVERLYNMQPRIHPLHKKLAWTGRIMKLILFRRN